jgi:carbamoyltransferase
MIVLGINQISHDAGAAIVAERDGGLEIVAIQEARLNRVKNSARWPLLAIRYCLDALGLRDLGQVDRIARIHHGGPEGAYSLENAVTGRRKYADLDYGFGYLVEQSLRADAARIEAVGHVDAHAASAYFLSPFDHAAVLSLEGGVGVFEGRGTTLRPIDRHGYDDAIWRDGVRLDEPLPPAFAPDYAGKPLNCAHLFLRTTLKCGFGFFDSGKTMALASYRDQFPKREVLPIEADRFDRALIRHDAAIAALDRMPRFDAKTHPQGAAGLIDPVWVNLARQVQDTLEEDVLHMAARARRKTGARHLAYAGGVALSCIANRRLHDARLFDDIFVQPAASDEGLALGAALAALYRAGGTKRRVMSHAYLGRPNDPSSLASLLDRHGITHRVTTDDEVAALIAEGRIVGRFHGAAEAGPRALGNRSILADPRRPEMARILNERVKHRESFRPFAPACHADKRERYFDMPMEGPFMIVAAPVKPEARAVIPAIVHVDGSARPQTVRPDQNPAFHALIEAFGRRTGVYVLINTSFNDNGEPIAESYEDALVSFARTGLDHLYIEDRLVDRPADPGALLAALADKDGERMRTRYRAAATGLCDRQRWQAADARLKAARATPPRAGEAWTPGLHDI